MTAKGNGPVLAVKRKGKEPSARELFAGMTSALGAATMVMH